MSLKSRNIPSIFGPLPVAAEPTMIPLSFCLGTQDGSAFRNCNNYTILLKFESNHLWEMELTVWLNSLRVEWFEKTRWFWWLCFASVKSGNGHARLYNVRFAAEEKGLPSNILRRDAIARALFQKKTVDFLKSFCLHDTSMQWGQGRNVSRESRVRVWRKDKRVGFNQRTTVRG